MGLLKILFVILLCAPMAYFCLRLIVQLIDQVIAKPKTAGREHK